MTATTGANVAELHRAEFVGLLAQFTAHHAADVAARDALSAEYLATLRERCKEKDAEFRALHPKSKRKPLDVGTLDCAACRKALGHDVVDPIFEMFKARVEAIYVEQKAAREKLEAELDRVASLAALHAGELRLWRTVYSSSYSTQGFGAISYAVGSAEMTADKARAAGIEVEVRRVNAHTTPGGFAAGGGVPHADIEVWVKVESDVDFKILEHRPGLSLRESVRLCWKRGVNPRVYNPFLSVGYEERNGLDYFGNDLRTGGEKK